MRKSCATKVPPDRQIVEAWVEAGSELGIRVVAPFKLLSEDGSDRWFEAYVRDFGGPNGTIAGNSNDKLGDIRQQRGYYVSNLSSSYRKFDRQHFIDTLNDWGWFGERGKEPPWYTGRPWS